MASIAIKDLVGFVLAKQQTADEAMAAAVRLGLDTTELAMALGVKPPPLPGQEPEDPTPAWRVTARGVRAKGEGTPDGKPFPFVWAGGCPWTVEPTGSDTKDVSEAQYARVKVKADKGRIVILKAERIRREETALTSVQEQRPQQQNGRR